MLRVPRTPLDRAIVVAGAAVGGIAAVHQTPAWQIHEVPLTLAAVVVLVEHWKRITNTLKTSILTTTIYQLPARAMMRLRWALLLLLLLLLQILVRLRCGRYRNGSVGVLLDNGCILACHRSVAHVLVVRRTATGATRAAAAICDATSSRQRRWNQSTAKYLCF